MKKTLIAVAALVSVASSVLAQGTVFFNNGNTTRISTNSVIGGAATGTTLANTGANSFYYALFFSTTATTVNGSGAAIVGSTGTYAFSDGGWTLATSGIGTNTATVGRFGSQIADSNSITQIANLAGGATAQFVVIGWSANIGNSVAQLAAWYNNGTPLTAGYIGESVVSGAITTGILNSTPTASLFGTGAGLIQGFTLGLVPVPEPATMAMAGLGGLALLALRRKK